MLKFWIEYLQPEVNPNGREVVREGSTFIDWEIGNCGTVYLLKRSFGTLDNIIAPLLDLSRMSNENNID